MFWGDATNLLEKVELEFTFEMVRWQVVLCINILNRMINSTDKYLENTLIAFVFKIEVY